MGYVAVVVVLAIVFAVSYGALKGVSMSEVVATIKAGPKADVLVSSDPYNTTMGVLGLAMAVVVYFQPPILVAYAYNFCAPGFAQLMPGLFLGLFWKRANEQGAIAGLIAGFAMVIYTNCINNPFGLRAIVCGLIANTVVFVIVSLLTKQDDKAVHEIVELLRRFFKSCDCVSHKLWWVYTAALFFAAFFIMPHIPNDMYIGWCPLLIPVRRT